TGTGRRTRTRTGLTPRTPPPAVPPQLPHPGGGAGRGGLPGGRAGWRGHPHPHPPFQQFPRARPGRRAGPRSRPRPGPPPPYIATEQRRAQTDGRTSSVRLIKLAIGAANPTVGAVRSNADQVIRMAREMAAQDVTVGCFPEQVLGGYPPEDLVQWPAF